MRHFFIYIMMVVFFAGCDGRGNDLPCESLSGPTPCAWAIEETSYQNFPRPADSYNFTNCPGTEEWDVMVDHKPFYQIPDCVLKKMSTHAVIQAVCEYYNNLYIMNTPSGAIGDEDLFEAGSYTTNVMNAYTELFKRKDAGKAFLERLRLMEPVTFYQSQWFEYLFGHRIFLSKLNNNQKREVVEICLRNDAIRVKDGRLIYRGLTFVLISRTMLAAKYAPFMNVFNDNEELQFFVNGSRMWDEEEALIYDSPKRYRVYDLVSDENIYLLLFELSKNYVK